MPLTPILDKKLRQLLATVAAEQSYGNYDLQITPVSSGGANYSSTLHKAKIQENGKDDLDLFVKVAALGDETRDIFEMKAYKAEHYVYKTLKKVFTDLETKYKVPEEDRLVMPKYYGAVTTLKEEMIVLEDLTAKGFKCYDRFKVMDWPNASSAVRELAKFHALGLACSKEFPKQYHNITHELKTDWIGEQMFNEFFKPNLNQAVEVVKDENREKLKKFIEKVNVEYVLKMYEPLINKPAWTHTDFRPSNLMYKYRENGTVEVITIDYQTIRPGSMVTDLLNFIFLSFDGEFRRQHFDQLVAYYYSQLKAAMTRLGLSDDEYSRDDFDYEFKKKLPEGLVVALVGLPIITVQEEDAPTLETGLELSQIAGFKTGALYSDRMNGVVDDYVRWGLI